MTYYKITGNSCDNWEIVLTKNKSGDCYETFAEAKKELIEIFQATIEEEKEALSSVRKLKKADIKIEF